MLTEKNVTEALGEILVPGIKRDLAGMNLLQEVKVSGKQGEVKIATAALDESAMEWLKGKAAEVVKGLEAGAEVKIDFIEKKPAELNQVKNVIAVMSGKGGVGKSLVTALSAILLSRRGYSVGILDADITGPSIPKMFGTGGHPSGSETGILPVLSANRPDPS